MNAKSIFIKRNIFSGIIRKIVSIALPFIIRTAIIYCLGAEYLGLNSLFTSILAVLNMTELGFSNAIVFSMYEPIAKKDKNRVCQLLSFYKKIYRLIGIIILAGGILILPFISVFIKGTWPNDINIYILFLIYLLNTTISYFFFAYKSALLNATQRLDIYNWIQTGTFLAQYIIQIIVLVLCKNYYIYVIFTPIFAIVCNLLTAYYSNKLFPEYQCIGELRKCEKKNIMGKVKGILVSKLSETSRNSIASIVLSSFFGLITVAIYNNYYYIFSAIYSILVAINQGLQASIGQSLVVEKPENNYNEMRKYNFYVMWIVGWASICLICLYKPFMALWAGENMLLGWIDTILFGIYFYALNMNNVRNLYFDGYGLWLEGKWSFVFETMANLILCVILGNLYGITGILIGLIIAIFLFSFIYRTYILFECYFKISPKVFLRDHLINLLVILIGGGITIFLCRIFENMNYLLQLIINGAICFLIPNMLLSAIYKKNQYFVEAKMKIRRKIKI